MDISRYSRSLADISKYLISVEFSRIIKSMEFNRFLKYRVDIGENLRLSRFLKFWFRVRAVYYKAFLLVIEGGK